MSNKIVELLTDEELSYAYSIVPKQPTTSKVVSKLINEHAEAFSRTRQSLRFTVVRMYITIHKDVPKGLTDCPDWYKVSNNILEFLEGKDHEIDQEFLDLKAGKTPKIKVERPDAIKMMSRYYYDNRDKLPRNITNHREVIINRLMEGVEPKKAFVV